MNFTPKVLKFYYTNDLLKGLNFEPWRIKKSSSTWF